LRHPARLREAAALWRPSGARIGLEHAGADLHDLAELHALGLDYIKIDGAFVQGAATEPAVCELARGLVLLLRGMGLPLLAEAVHDEADLVKLWSLGFHGATGPAVQAA
jgi:EAL domain-containing protein (putative c-di-GMP-specific phosphodiesterase class I)